MHFRRLSSIQCIGENFENLSRISTGNLRAAAGFVCRRGELEGMDQTNSTFLQYRRNMPNICRNCCWKVKNTSPISKILSQSPRRHVLKLMVYFPDHVEHVSFSCTHIHRPSPLWTTRANVFHNVNFPPPKKKKKKD